MVVERVGRPVLPKSDPSGPWGGPRAMAQFEDVSEHRPVSGAGVRDMIEEEEPVGSHVESTPGPGCRAPG